MKAELTILAPDLLTRLDGGPRNVAVPLARTLARATRRRAAAPPYEDALAALFDIAPANEGSPPLAAITAAYDLEQPAPGLLRADPVYLRADPNRLFLFDAAALALDAAEADALLAALNAAFAGTGLAFLRGRAAARWYLQGAPAPAAATHSPQRLRGQPLEPDFATMQGLGPLKRVMTEAQMVLHDCATNEQRVAAGKPPVNSVWPWGGGAPQTLGAGPPTALCSDDDLALACAMHRGVPIAVGVAELLSGTAAAGGAVAVVCTPGGALTDPQRFGDAVLAPALAALARGALGTVDIDGGAWRLHFSRGTRWRFWRGAGGFLDALRVDPAERS